MNPAVASFAGGLVGLIVFASVSLLVLRLPGRLSPVMRLALLAVGIHLLTTCVLAWLIPGVTYWHGAALYWFGFNCLLYAYSAVYKSVSLQLLSELVQVPYQSLAMQKIVDEQVRPCFAGRAALLVHSGLARADKEKYAIASKGVNLAGRLTFVQRLFGVQRSGLYSGSPRS